ncbi:MAG: PIN domain-containing protein [Microcystis panniformis Mp_MB_F_20051200_S9]|jgi:predicted nucleic acid-binding protein|uniref:PIN domain-containing protein n=1 Tax=Microcystis panniformis Mp_MB_F_20051200_S9 TaxID=2486223 RepID=A0A552PUZ8_9CHRO|nr:PIN domain-containing protein [Microcystis sp. LE19-131.1A]TRV44772.1 MAG: PIN domain-containing protein [Microcystis panniformis Mp_MB_F_20080800_S26D]TRV45877.1 MAG: PIN domain-containing protein [Microcystis panniformis Mp_GB_SS_20050300_S99]TRV47733.1 MAG: PIN domain-containing protein [Microcystis panniformis Mp_GB_SS_20050300_S99D]TRV54397.1 MAG: PIN domain-containing protein [Microcystis panniformis Mp_MB_F_20080800_S26]TRV56462.1 MAG: PIN domain-containing protein [Microcystis panni
MANYLFDTNILLRLSDRISANYALARDATYILIDQGHKCCLTSQIIIEFWVVATRPTGVNGLGWTPERTKNQINQFLNRFTVLEETPEIFTLWFQLVSDYNIKGKRTHDIRLLAVMKAHNITHLLTFNPDDFLPLPNIIIVQPQDFLNP